MKIKHNYIEVLSLCLLLVLPCAYAKDASADKEEVKVEWDLSKRPTINAQPFSRVPADTDSFGHMAPDAFKNQQDKDLLENIWTVHLSDGTVRRLFQRWADDAGYQLLWEVPRDYPIEVEMKLNGKFRDALWTVAKSLSLTDAPVQVSLNPNIRLIRVVRYLNGQAR